MHQGGGTLRSVLGDLRVRRRRLRVRAARPACIASSSTSGAQYWLSIECAGGVGPLKQWRNDVGQLRMDAPYSHRDFKRPTFVGPARRGHPHRRGQARRRVPRLRAGRPRRSTSSAGTARSIRGRSRSSTSSRACRRCTCRRRGTARSPRAARSSAASCRGRSTSTPTRSRARIRTRRSTATSSSSTARGNFTSRKGVGPGSISHHPAGIPHGPHPGAYESSIGTKAHRRARGHARHLRAAVTDGGRARRRGSRLSRQLSLTLLRERQSRIEERLPPAAPRTTICGAMSQRTPAQSVRAAKPRAASRPGASRCPERAEQR